MDDIFKRIQTLSLPHLRACQAHVDLLVKFHDVTSTIESAHAEDSDLVMSELKKFGLVLPAKTVKKRGRKPDPNSVPSIAVAMLKEHGEVLKTDLLEALKKKLPNVPVFKLNERLNHVRGIHKSQGVWQLAA